MPVYKNSRTKKTTWLYRVYDNDEFGNRKQYSKNGFKTKSEAKKAEQIFLLNHNRNNNINNNGSDDDITFQDLYDVYIKHKEQTLKDKSFVTYESIFKIHILPYFRDFKLSEITNKVYIEWKEKILNKNLSYKYNSNIHICMVSILNYAMKFYDLEKNIASQVGNFSKKNYKPKVDFWTYEEFSKFIENIKDIEYRVLYIVLYFTGARLGECLALSWNDIKNNYIDINKTISRGRKGENYIIQSPKTPSSIRKVQLDDYTINTLNGLKEHYKLFYDFNNNWFVFGGIKPLSRTTIATKKNECCNAIGIKKIRIHDFRHSHASFLVSKNIPFTAIKQRLGHKDLTTTLNTYSHLVPSDEDKAINCINNLRKGI